MAKEGKNRLSFPSAVSTIDCNMYAIQGEGQWKANAQWFTHNLKARQWK